jgi:hypothetical protein
MEGSSQGHAPVSLPTCKEAPFSIEYEARVGPKVSLDV